MGRVPARRAELRTTAVRPRARRATGRARPPGQQPGPPLPAALLSARRRGRPRARCERRSALGCRYRVGAPLLPREEAEDSSLLRPPEDLPQPRGPRRAQAARKPASSSTIDGNASGRRYFPFLASPFLGRRRTSAARRALHVAIRARGPRGPRPADSRSPRRRRRVRGSSSCTPRARTT